MKKAATIISVVIAFLLIIYFAFPQVLLKIIECTGRSSAHLSEKTVQVGEYTIPYLEGGAGETVLMVHGLGGDKDYWTAFAKRITPSFRVIALDLPGTGSSTKIVTDLYTVSAQVQRIEKFIDALKLDKVHLLGHSMGGRIASRYAATHPQKTASLALFDTEGVAAPEMSEFEKSVAAGINPLSITSVKEFEGALKFLFYEPPSVPWPVKRYLTNQSMQNNDFNQKIFWDIYQENYSIEKDLASLMTNVFIVWGDTDRRLHVSSVGALKKACPKAASIIIKNCGHFPMREKPEETAGYYLDFLKKKQ